MVWWKNPAQQSGQDEGPQGKDHVCLNNPITFFDKKTGFMDEERVVEIIYF